MQDPFTVKKNNKSYAAMHYAAEDANYKHGACFKRAFIKPIKIFNKLRHIAIYLTNDGELSTAQHLLTGVGSSNKECVFTCSPPFYSRKFTFSCTTKNILNLFVMPMAF